MSFEKHVIHAFFRSKTTLVSRKEQFMRMKTTPRKYEFAHRIQGRVRILESDQIRIVLNFCSLDANI